MALRGPEQRPRGGSPMIWSVRAAAREQAGARAPGASACGAVAVENVLRALGLGASADAVERAVRTRLRELHAPLPRYLMSRSVAGATHEQLLEGADGASEGRVTGRFFSFYPERAVDLTSWLAGWIRKGAVPVATMNMQVAVPEGEEIPDAWHHQMIFGVGAEGIYMTNPLELVSSHIVKQHLCSASLLLIRQQDVLARLPSDAEQSVLTELRDHLPWRQLDVAGQVARIIAGNTDGLGSPHLVIPAAYKSGITLFVLRHSEVASELFSAAELPLSADGDNQSLNNRENRGLDSGGN
ncbi:uncharacterized protein LOC127578994 [Pristis pectinata]|uniref:uncharacterized protein LOC127578994 n=1 Tax=Pristis pectinata TaxID=685728 RepID=UPI00223E8890|nr:uncharacterized protein LOC127578994 [Pristis pectinata]